jgi:6-phosphogluconolactonase (cycloisomerase 2 family)
MGSKRRAVAALAAAVSVAGAAAAAPQPSKRPPFGALTPLAGAAGCLASVDRGDGCGLARGLEEVHSVSISPDGRNVYTASASEGTDPPQDDATIGVFARNARTGALTQLPGSAGCIRNPEAQSGLAGCTPGRSLHLARFVTVSPDGRFVYEGGYQGVTVFWRSAATGALTQLPGEAGCLGRHADDGCAKVDTVDKTEDGAITKDGRFAYVANLGTDVLTVFRRDPASGVLTQLADAADCVADGGDPPCAQGRALNDMRGVTLSPDERSVYVAALADEIAVFSRNRVTGRVKQLPGTSGCITETGDLGCATGRGIYGPHRVTPSPDGRFVYMAGKRGNNRGSAVAVFARNETTGALTQLPGPPGCVSQFEPDVPPEPAAADDGCLTRNGMLGAHAAILDPEGRTVYVVSDRGVIVLTTFRRDAATGKLHALPDPWGCIGAKPVRGCTVAPRANGLHFLVLSPDGRFAYAAEEASGALLAFRRQSG